jgi:hypothetical protein
MCFMLFSSRIFKREDKYKFIRSDFLLFLNMLPYLNNMFFIEFRFSRSLIVDVNYILGLLYDLSAEMLPKFRRYALPPSSGPRFST